MIFSGRETDRDNASDQRSNRVKRGFSVAGRWSVGRTDVRMEAELRNCLNARHCRVISMQRDGSLSLAMSGRAQQRFAA